jgi:protein-S-isoprenylcysteine O-methyltransferase Ste14
MASPPLFFCHLIGASIINWLVPFAIPGTLIMRITGGLALAVDILLIGSVFSQMVNAHSPLDANRPTAALVTTGPYRFSRNPINLGFFLIYLGFTFLPGTLRGILLSSFLFLTVTHAVINLEEEFLKKKFKDECTRCSSHTRRWI